MLFNFLNFSSDLDAKRPFFNANVPSTKISTSDTNMDDDVMYAAPDQNLLTEDQGPVGYIEVAVDPGLLSSVPNYAEPDTNPDPDDVELNPIYAGTQIYEDPYQTVTGSSLYADPHAEKERLSIEIKKFPREKLRFLEKIGEGQFGEVSLCLRFRDFCVEKEQKKHDVYFVRMSCATVWKLLFCWFRFTFVKLMRSVASCPVTPTAVGE